MANRIGQRIGNYRLIHRLGSGSFAEVYLGQHIFLETQAAIKVLHMQLTKNDLENFLTESRTIASLVHPHIVRVLEFGVEGNNNESRTNLFSTGLSIPYLVMAYAPNGTLRQRYPKNIRLSLDIIVFYIKQIAEALQYAHAQKLVHRDIKPENMLIGRNGEILLSDFGIAWVDQSSHYLDVQEMIGTLSYMAPEQIKGNSCFASDQYSLGVVTYEWLSGKCPFHGSFTEIATQHMFALPPQLHENFPTFRLLLRE